MKNNYLIKRLTAVILSAIFVFSLFSCSKGDSVNGDTRDFGEPAQSAGEDTREFDEVIQSASYEYLSPQKLEEEADLIAVLKFTGSTEQVILPDQAEKEYPDEIYTDYEMQVIDTVKGEAPESIKIRAFGGTYNGIIYSRRGNPDFEEGRKYFIYLRRDPQTDRYSLIAGGGNIFDIKDDGTPDVESKKSQEDTAEIMSLYNSNINAADIAAIQ